MNPEKERKFAQTALAIGQLGRAYTGDRMPMLRDLTENVLPATIEGAYRREQEEAKRKAKKNKLLTTAVDIGAAAATVATGNPLVGTGIRTVGHAALGDKDALKLKTIGMDLATSYAGGEVGELAGKAGATIGQKFGSTALDGSGAFGPTGQTVGAVKGESIGRAFGAGLSGQGAKSVAGEWVPNQPGFPPMPGEQPKWTWQNKLGGDEGKWGKFANSVAQQTGSVIRDSMSTDDSSGPPTLSGSTYGMRPDQLGRIQQENTEAWRYGQEQNWRRGQQAQHISERREDMQLDATREAARMQQQVDLAGQSQRAQKELAFSEALGRSALQQQSDVAAAARNDADNTSMEKRYNMRATGAEVTESEYLSALEAQDMYPDDQGVADIIDRFQLQGGGGGGGGGGQSSGVRQVTFGPNGEPIIGQTPAQKAKGFTPEDAENIAAEPLELTTELTPSGTRISTGEAVNRDAMAAFERNNNYGPPTPSGYSAERPVAEPLGALGRRTNEQLRKEQEALRKGRTGEQWRAWGSEFGPAVAEGAYEEVLGAPSRLLLGEGSGLDVAQTAATALPVARAGKYAYKGTIAASRAAASGVRATLGAAKGVGRATSKLNVDIGQSITNRVSRSAAEAVQIQKAEKAAADLKNLYAKTEKELSNRGNSVDAAREGFRAIDSHTIKNSIEHLTNTLTSNERVKLYDMVVKALNKTDGGAAKSGNAGVKLNSIMSELRKMPSRSLARFAHDLKQGL